MIAVLFSVTRMLLLYMNSGQCLTLSSQSVSNSSFESKLRFCMLSEASDFTTTYSFVDHHNAGVLIVHQLWSFGNDTLDVRSFEQRVSVFPFLFF